MSMWHYIQTHSKWSNNSPTRMLDLKREHVRLHLEENLSRAFSNSRIKLGLIGSMPVTVNFLGFMIYLHIAFQ